MTEGSFSREYIGLETAPKGRYQQLKPRHLRNLAEARAFLGDAEPVHFDFETTGVEAWHPDQRVVLVGLANSRGCCSVDARGWQQSDWDQLKAWFKVTSCWAFNAAFDGSWCYRYFGELPNLGGCSMVAFKLLANEGYAGQSHSLAKAERVINWPGSNKATLEQLLVRHGLVKSNGTSPDKSQMWRLQDLEPQAFNDYCAWDALASYQLTDWLKQECERLEAPVTWQYATDEWPAMILSMIEAQHEGLTVDVDRLRRYYDRLQTALVAAEEAFRTHPKVQPYIQAYEAGKAEDFTANWLPPKKKIASKKEYDADPDAHTLEDLDPAKKYPVWMKELGSRPYRMVTSVYPKLKADETPKFNLNSDVQLKWLLYGCLYEAEFIPPRREYFSGDYRVQLEDDDEVIVSATKSGAPPVGKDILPALGEVGALLTEYNRIEKLLAYVTAYLEVAASGTLHPSFKPHGTITGRQSGGADASEGVSTQAAVNVQQLPKDVELLGCFRSRPGHVLLDYDFPSLEPRVQAHFSGDKTLWDLYGKGIPHDVYLYVMSKLAPNATEVAQVYRPDSDSPDIKGAKAAFGKERPIYKQLHLSAAYKAGPWKIYTSLRIQGVKVTLEEVKTLHFKYWQLFGGIKRWEQRLLKEREDRGGWIYNGRGRFQAVCDRKLKDIVNTYTQGTGHDLLLTLNWYVRKIKDERGVKMRAWLPDTHDQITWEAPEHEAERAKQVIDDAVEALAAELKSKVPFPPGAEIGECFADFK